jgi:hypothetical protein
MESFQGGGGQGHHRLSVSSSLRAPGVSLITRRFGLQAVEFIDFSWPIYLSKAHSLDIQYMREMTLSYEYQNLTPASRRSAQERPGRASILTTDLYTKPDYQQVGYLAHERPMWRGCQSCAQKSLTIAVDRLFIDTRKW